MLFLTICLFISLIDQQISYIYFLITYRFNSFINSFKLRINDIVINTNLCIKKKRNVVFNLEQNQKTKIYHIRFSRIESIFFSVHLKILSLIQLSVTFPFYTIHPIAICRYIIPMMPITRHT